MFRKGIFEPARIIDEFANAMATFAAWMVLVKTRAPAGTLTGLSRIGTGNQPLERSFHRNSAMAPFQRTNL